MYCNQEETAQREAETKELASKYPVTVVENGLVSEYIWARIPEWAAPKGTAHVELVSGLAGMTHAIYIKRTPDEANPYWFFMPFKALAQLVSHIQTLHITQIAPFLVQVAKQYGQFV